MTKKVIRDFRTVTSWWCEDSWAISVLWTRFFSQM